MCSVVSGCVPRAGAGTPLPVTENRLTASHGATAQRTTGELTPPPGTIAVWSDVTCPWAGLAVHRLHAARSRMRLTGSVRLDHRAFPLELINERPTPKRVLDGEVPVIGAHEPALGWQVWQRPDSEWPGTVLLALEAVQAAKAESVGGHAASEELDLALRRAFFAESRPIGLYAEVVAVARTCPSVVVERLEEALRRGEGRDRVLADWRESGQDRVQGSPHLFLPDGSDAHNPGVTIRSTGKPGQGFTTIVSDDPTVYDDLVGRAAATV